jgi:hypothetical protein
MPFIPVILKTRRESRQKIKVRVNAPYPDDEPLSNVPPQLLLNLPRLPDSVTYRFVGRDLILRDSKAALIVDFIREVTP